MIVVVLIVLFIGMTVGGVLLARSAHQQLVTAADECGQRFAALKEQVDLRQQWLEYLVSTMPETWPQRQQTLLRSVALSAADDKKTSLAYLAQQQQQITEAINDALAVLSSDSLQQLQIATANVLEAINEYNACAEKYNALLQQMPHTWVSKAVGMGERELFVPHQKSGDIRTIN